MFIDLIKIWSEQDFSAEVVGEFLSMLKRSEEMLSYVFGLMTGGMVEDKYQEEIYIKDQGINFTEREIRKKILVHLSTDQKTNLPACLALISVSKDAERLGDYVKNIFELKKHLKSYNCDKELFKTIFDLYGKQILVLFSKVRQAFKDSDIELAKESVVLGREIGKKCEEAIEKVVDSDLNLREGVVIALGARYLKRIALHLSNIASSVVNPMPEMDYFNKRDDE